VQVTWNLYDNMYISSTRSTHLDKSRAVGERLKEVGPLVKQTQLPVGA
jgi:hypothetical protein